MVRGVGAGIVELKERCKGWAEGWWVRNERDGGCSVGLAEETGAVEGGVRRALRLFIKAVFRERVRRRARFSFFVSRILRRRARIDSGVGALGRSGSERF